MLADKRIFVTGSSRGLGRAIALACAREGAVVGVHYRVSKDAAEEVAAQARTLSGREAFVLSGDVASPDAVTAMADEFVKRASRLDGWVSSAGVIAPGLLVTMDDDSLRRLVDVNVLGPLYGARAAIPHMLKQRSGVLLQIGSIAATRPSRGQVAYAATKGAVEAMTRALAVEYGRKGIRAVCLAPGATATDMLEGTKRLAEGAILDRIPLRRIAEPEEIAEAAVFLLSDRASYLTGSVYAADGGANVG